MDRRSVYRQVAHLHAAAIDRGFLSELGEPFLTLLYQAIDEDASSVLITRSDQDRIVGFVSGGSGLGPLYRRLLRRGLSVVRSLLPTMLSPRKIRKVAELLWHSREDEAAALPRAELMSIAVSPDLRRSGCAAELYRELCQHFRQHGVDDFKIVVGDALAPAQAFYRKMGAEPVSQITVHGDATSTVFVHRLT
jgi:ribosomal protein S18 acetylase RimI-like enzyme